MFVRLRKCLYVVRLEEIRGGLTGGVRSNDITVCQSPSVYHLYNTNMAHYLYACFILLAITSLRSNASIEGEY